MPEDRTWVDRDEIPGRSSPEAEDPRVERWTGVDLVSREMPAGFNEIAALVACAVRDLTNG